jgi:glycosyltransferase involved in cell wall biosynthesis
MRILIVLQAVIPVHAYGGTERVVWDLGKALLSLGHQVTYLVNVGSSCSFAPVLEIKPEQPVLQQIPTGFDVVHFQFNPGGEPSYPYLVTEHGNTKKPQPLPRNTVFVSQNHAQRYQAHEFVHNGLDWAAYGTVNLQAPRPYFHFLGKGSWPVKNLRGAIAVARKAQQPLAVLGAKRLNLSRGFRFTPWPSIQFHGMVGGAEKFQLLQHSKGLIFPVRWHEPFGLAVIESLYFGCPVFATPYGALPELVPQDVGYLSSTAHELAQAVQAQQFSPAQCHAWARDHFNHIRMGQNYLKLYERVAAGEQLHAQAPMLPVNGHQALDWQA